MDGVGGKPGWAWIFILEGLFTVLCAIASFFILSDFPDTAKFLNETERKRSADLLHQGRLTNTTRQPHQAFGLCVGYRPI